MKHKRKIDSCGIILLAAGSSHRLGTPKQLLPFKGVTLLQHAVSVAFAANAETTLVVLGANASRIKEEISEMPVDIVINKQYEEGMASSIKAGIQCMLKKYPHLNGLIMMVCDQPYVTPQHLRNLVDRQISSGAAIVASFYGNRKGVPAPFHQDLFHELLQLEGDTGARKKNEKHQHESASVAFPFGKTDIDTMEAYEALIRETSWPPKMIR